MTFLSIGHRRTLHVRFSVAQGEDLIQLAFRDVDGLFGDQGAQGTEGDWWCYSPVYRAFSSPTMSRLFVQMVRWLEAVHLGADLASFCWDGEGPDGELAWEAETRHVGRLRFLWTGSRWSRRSEPVDHTHRIRREDLVRAFYEGYLEFLGSERFDRRHFVNFTLAEMLTFRFKEPMDEVLDALASLEAERASEWLVRAIQGMDHRKPAKLSTREFDAAAALPEVGTPSPQTASGMTSARHDDSIFGSAYEQRWVRDALQSPDWQAGDKAQRRAYLEARLDDVVWLCSENEDGPIEKRLPRSKLIEAWLDAERAGAVNAGGLSHE